VIASYPDIDGAFARTPTPPDAIAFPGPSPVRLPASPVSSAVRRPSGLFPHAVVQAPLRTTQTGRSVLQRRQHFLVQILRAFHAVPRPANHPATPSGPCSTSLRNTSTGLTARTSNSGGRQNSTVVSRPVPSPAAIDRQGNSRAACTGSRLPKTAGSAPITPTPAATPSNPPASPSPRVCSRKIRNKSADPAPTAFRIAS